MVKKSGFTPLEKVHTVRPVRKLFSNGVKEHSSLTGFTLVEIIVSAVIFVLVAIVIASIVSIADKLWQEDTAFVELQQTLRHTIDAMLREIRQSKPSDIILDTLSNGAKITFKVPENNNNISYYLENINGEVFTVREHPPGTKSFLTRNIIDSLCFCWDSATDSCSIACSDVLTVRITANRAARQRILTFNLLEKVRLRNE